MLSVHVNYAYLSYKVCLVFCFLAHGFIVQVGLKSFVKKVGKYNCCLALYSLIINFKAVIKNCSCCLNSCTDQIERRRKGLFPVQPKPPQGFKDYLMNRCTYVLAGNASSRLSVPVMSPPQNLQGAMKDLFSEQEKERYRLRMQVKCPAFQLKFYFSVVFL